MKQTRCKRTEREALLSLDETARVLGLTKVAADARRARKVVLAMVARGELVGVRVSKWVLIDPASLDRYLGRT